MTDSSDSESANQRCASESAQQYFQQAVGCLQNGELGQARSFARQAADVVDSDWSGLERLGLVLLRLGELSRSFAVLQQAKRNGQLHGRGFRSLAALFHQSGQSDQARLCIEAMAQVAAISGPSRLRSGCPRVLQLVSVRRSRFGIQKDQKTGLCSISLRGGHFSLSSVVDLSRINLFTAIFLGDNVIQIQDMPQFDLFINSLSCADHDAYGLEDISRFLNKYSQTPVINHPSQILLTSRSENACRLGDLPHVVMPRMEPFVLSRCRDRVLAQLQRMRLTYPVIARVQGGHGSSNMYKAESQLNLYEWFLDYSAGCSFYVMPFVDYRWDDGLFHQFRVFFIDGKMYPSARIISDHWEIHCDNPNRRDRYRVMHSNSSLRSLEERFLRDPLSCLGPSAMKALDQVKSLVRLDFFGIDFALDKNCNILIFEVNAAMSKSSEDVDDFPYLKSSMQKIDSAFSDLIRSRALAPARIRF